MAAFSSSFGVFAVEGIPEIEAGMDLGELIGNALAAREPRAVPRSSGVPGSSMVPESSAVPGSSVVPEPVEGRGLHHGDILVISSKIVSKAEGRIVRADDREQAITDETVRVVATRVFPRGVTRIVENHLGIVGAAAGVDASNTPDGTVLLLPLDPDASAARIRAALEERFEVAIGVVISDTLGRPWREGQTDVAIGGSGVTLLDDLRGTTDTQGRILDVTAPAVGDELAAAADLVKRKSDGLPVAVIRGLGHLVTADAVGARVLIRPSDTDMFRLGTDEAYAQGFKAGQRA